MAVSEEFLQAITEDKDLAKEVEEAEVEAISEFLKEKGLADEATRVLEAAAEKVAVAHGFESVEADELDIDDLEGVSGGIKIVVIKAPKMMSPILRMIFKIKKDQQ